MEVPSGDGGSTSTGKVEVAFGKSFIVKLEKDNTEIKYEIPRLEIASIIDDRISLKLKRSENRSKIQNIFDREKALETDYM